MFCKLIDKFEFECNRRAYLEVTFVGHSAAGFMSESSLRPPDDPQPTCCVIADYRAAYPDPITVCAGDELTVGDGDRSKKLMLGSSQLVMHDGRHYRKIFTTKQFLYDFKRRIRCSYVIGYGYVWRFRFSKSAKVVRKSHRYYI